MSHQLHCRVKTISLNDFWDSSSDSSHSADTLSHSLSNDSQSRSNDNRKSRTSSRGSGKKNQIEEVQHEIFEECMEVVQDEYWKQVFEQASFNRFPRLFSYSNGMLSFKSPHKRKKLEIPESAVEAATLCMAFFKECGGLYSNEDRIKTGQYREDNMDKSKFLENCKWSDIKKSKVRNILLEHYINTLAKQHGLDDVGKIMLETTINTGFMLKYFDNKDVVFENGRIQKIHGLIYSESEKNFIIDTKLEPLRLKNLKKNNVSDSTSTKSFSFIKTWNKFLKYLNKEYHQPGRPKVSHSTDDADSTSIDIVESDITE